MTEGSPEQLDSSPQDEMSILEHLGELRRRLLLALIAICAGAAISYTMAEEVFSLLSAPFLQGFETGQLIGTGPAEAFILKLKVSFFTGCLLASPVVFYQIWLFVAPGLHESERRLAIPFVFSTTALFCLGITFCYLVVFPFAYEFFYGQYESIGIAPQIRLTEHLALVIKALLGFGLVFELPVLTYFLAVLGVVTSQMLLSAFRAAVVVAFILSAVLTPPDVLTQFLMAGPLLLLYGVSIAIARLVEKERPVNDEPESS